MPKTPRMGLGEGHGGSRVGTDQPLPSGSVERAVQRGVDPAQRRRPDRAFAMVVGRDDAGEHALDVVRPQVQQSQVPHVGAQVQVDMPGVLGAGGRAQMTTADQPGVQELTDRDLGVVHLPCSQLLNPLRQPDVSLPLGVVTGGLLAPPTGMGGGRSMTAYQRLVEPSGRALRYT
jgi:hypothetical protein